MLRAACCVDAPGHECSLILVYGETLRVLLLSSAVDSTIYRHVDRSLEGEFPVAFFCKSDLVLHLSNVTDTDHLDQFLDLLVTINNVEAEHKYGGDTRGELTVDPLSRMESVFDRVAFHESSDIEPLLPKDGPGLADSTWDACDLDVAPPEDPFLDQSESELSSPEQPFHEPFEINQSLPPPSIASSSKMTGDDRQSFRSHVASIRSKTRSLLRDNYHRMADVIPKCPPGDDCSSCKKCGEAVKHEW